MSQVLNYKNVFLVRDGKQNLAGFDWRVLGSERWIVLGPNGAGKSTILGLAACTLFPTSGEVEVLGEKLGKVNVFDMRSRIGLASTQTERQLPKSETVYDAVITAAHSVSGRWKEEYEQVDERQAERSLGDFGLLDLKDRRLHTLSDGERRRVIIARAVMTDPELLLLDEPTSNLDLGARERLVRLLGEYAQSPYAPAMVMVTHHVEDIPPGFTHLLLLDAHGHDVAQGPIAETLTADNLEKAFGMRFEVIENDGRYQAIAK